MITDPTWIPGARGSGYGSDHLPFGRFRRAGSTHVGVRIGDLVLDLTTIPNSPAPADHFAGGTLTPLLASGPDLWREVRSWLRRLITDEDQRSVVEPHLVPVADIELLLPLDIGDYVDFYASEHHASNVGKMFRPDAPPLMPNWKHLPVAYHGRSGTIVASGTPIRRPLGQFPLSPGEPPQFGASRKLDIEAELGFVVGSGSTLGEPIPVDECEDHIFGVVGLNDWSARDIQAWEYVPLGPNLGKSFATTIAHWITPLAALSHARSPLPAQEPEPLPHLAAANLSGIDIAVTVRLGEDVVSTPPYASMYWAPAQMLAHLTSNGASVRPGDLFGSGTISGPHRDQRGSFLELSWNGTEAWGPRSRTGFLLDGDEVTLEYSARGEYGTIRLGDVRGRIQPAVPISPTR